MSYAAAAALPGSSLDGHRPALRAALGAVALVAAVALLAIALPALGTGPSGVGVRPSVPVAPAAGAAGAALLRTLPLAAQLTISRTVGADLPAYGLRANGPGAIGATPAQRLTERFDRTGVTVGTGAHRLRLALRTLAGGGTTVALPGATPTARANRVSYARGPVTEWYDNGPLGLEQSFRIAAAPAAGTRTLTLGLALSGTLAARAVRPAAGGTGLAFLDAHGATVLRYRGLVAHDAGGRALPARMHGTPGGGVALAVDTTGARYPVTVDPIVQQGRLTASDGIVGQHVGTPVAIAGDTIVLGSPGAVVGGNLQGAVYVFTKPAGGWGTGTETAKLYASDAGPGGGSNVYGDVLGSAVAIAGDTIVAGAPRSVDGGQPYAGKLYVFVKPGGGWTSTTQTAELGATDATTYDYLGSSVATDGTTVVGGAPGGGSVQHGIAYVYTKPAGAWTSATQTGRLTASGGTSSDSFATAVAVSGATVAVGAPYTQSGHGSVYTYKKPAGAWADAGQTATLTPATPVANESMGASVAIDGTTLVAGAPNNYNPGSAVASAYVFEQPSGGWIGPVTSAVRLTQADPLSADHFGGSVAISGTTITVASAFTAGPAAGTSGGVYVFTRLGATWSSTSVATKIGAADGNVQQADSAAVAGTTVVSSAKYAKVGDNAEQGAAFVFDTSGAPGSGGGGGGGGTGGGGTGTGGGTGSGGSPTTTPPTTVPPATPAPVATTPPATTATLTFVSTPTRVANDIGWGDIAANLLGIVPGSGATSDWGEFTFVAVCHQPDGCHGTITFGAQRPASGASVAKLTKAAPPYGRASFSLRKDQKRTLNVKLTAAARKLGRRRHKLTGTVTITTARPGAAPSVLHHALTLKLAPPKKPHR